MIEGAVGGDLLVEFAAGINEPEVRDAFVYFVGLAATQSAYSCRATRKGVVRDFRFYSATGVQPFSFIVNSQWLLFYFRKPSVSSGHFSLDRLRSEFPSAASNSAGEWTIRLASVHDVKKLWALIASAV